MSIKNILSYLGIALCVVGMVIGVGLIFSMDSLVLGCGIVVASVFVYIFCEWLSQMLDNSQEQTCLLKDIYEILDKENNNKPNN